MADASVPKVSIDQIQVDLDADRRWRERRHQQWTENYQLYRDTVITNRLTQRQSVNVPLMKATIRTLLSRAADPADLEFEDYDNDGQREILVNAYIDKVLEENKYELLDVVDKKNVGLYGRSWTKLNILDGFPRITVLDPFDVLVDRYASPWDIDNTARRLTHVGIYRSLSQLELNPFDVLVDRYASPWDIDNTARRLTHVGIYRSLSQLELNPLYNKDAIGRLREFFKTKQGLVIAGQNSLIVADRAKRLEDMGVPDAQYPLLGETYVELNEQQRKVWHPAEGKDVIHVVVTANGNEILMDKPLRNILNINFFTLFGWCDDPDATDVYPDGAGDIARVPNQILNVYLSQLVENGIMRGYGMNFYNAKVPGQEQWSPVGYVPAPFGFYPLPGKPADVLQHVEVPELKSHLEEMRMVQEMVESATAASAIEKGDTPEGAQTLGEINLMVAKADERLKDVPKFARLHAKQLGDKLIKLVNANTDKLKPVTLYKKSASGAYWEKTIKPSDLKAPKGYNCVVTLKTEKESDDLKTIQKIDRKS